MTVDGGTAAEGRAAAVSVAFRILSRPECLNILRSRSVGRVGISRHALPAIAPVAYALLGDGLVFGPHAGSGELAALEGNVVAFQVDDIDPETGGGCSVVAVGVVQLFDGSRLDRRHALIVRRSPQAGAASVDLYSLSTQRITGRAWGPTASLRAGPGPQPVRDACRRE